jgi:hypothetical protein
MQEFNPSVPNAARMYAYPWTAQNGGIVTVDTEGDMPMTTGELAPVAPMSPAAPTLPGIAVQYLTRVAGGSTPRRAVRPDLDETGPGDARSRTVEQVMTCLLHGDGANLLVDRNGSVHVLGGATAHVLDEESGAEAASFIRERRI